MKNTYSLLFGLLLVASLTLSGPFGMEKAGGDGELFSIEICAYGVVETVLVAADGQPVEPTQDCRDCLTCSNANGSQPNTTFGAALSFALLEIGSDRPASQNPIYRKRNVLPVPRGPRGVHLSVLGSPEKIGRDHASNDHKKRSHGRPLLKDANA
jgi:hypothetical protein